MNSIELPSTAKHGWGGPGMSMTYMRISQAISQGMRLEWPLSRGKSRQRQYTTRLNLDAFRISEVHCSGGGVCSMTADSLMKCPSHYCLASG
jgi:hypothetical protein